jgi:hypothetical protein
MVSADGDGVVLHAGRGGCAVVVLCSQHGRAAQASYDAALHPLENSHVPPCGCSVLVGNATVVVAHMSTSKLAPAFSEMPY